MMIMVTGGSGFIGTRLVTELLNEGHRVRIYDKKRSVKYPDLSIVEDIRDFKKLNESMAGVDAVYHLAAEHRDDVHPASLYYDVNVGGAENVVAGAANNKIDKIIFTSSVAVYGLNFNNVTEKSTTEPLNDYGRSKLESEKVFVGWVEKSERNFLVIVRPTVIFGEDNRGNMYNLIEQINTNRFVMIGAGKNSKSIGYVENIVDFLKGLLIDCRAGKYIYNYADKPDLSMNELVGIISQKLGREKSFRIRIPYSIGYLGGVFFDLLSIITKKKFSHKCCSY